MKFVVVPDKHNSFIRVSESIKQSTHKNVYIDEKTDKYIRMVLDDETGKLIPYVPPVISFFGIGRDMIGSTFRIG